MNAKNIIKLLLVFLPVLSLVLFSCDDKDDNNKDSELVSFTGLVADDDTVLVGESTTIRAIYEGKGVTFEWDATSGNLIGGGDKVDYIVAFCDLGENTITCKATAANTSITKTIQVYVALQ